LQASINWHEEGSKLQSRIIDALDKSIMPDLKKNITDISFMTPEDFCSNYLSSDGAGFSIAPEFSQSAWFRFHNKGEGIKNLFLAGSGTHPGGGVPGVLSSAKVLDRLIPTLENSDVL
jgi:phytoene desaturase